MAALDDADAARAAAGRLRERHGGVKALVHLGGLEPADAPDGAPATGVTGLFLLAQALRDDLERAAAEGGAAVVAATAMGGTFGLDGEVPATASRQGLVAGFIKTLAHEWPSVRARVVDLAPGEPAAHAAALAAELTRRGPVEIGLRDGARVTLEPQPAPLAGRPDGGLLDAGSVLLVTGGARGITAEATVALARGAAGLTVVLVGRTPLTEEDPADAGLAGRRAQAGR